MRAPLPTADTCDLPSREDVQELRQAIESLRDHVQIVWQAIDEVREVIEQSIGADAAEFWTVEPSQGFGLGRYKPFAGYNPFDEWHAENDEASVEPPPVLLTSDSDDEPGGTARLPTEVFEHVQSDVAVYSQDSPAETHRHSGQEEVDVIVSAATAKQRSLFDPAQQAVTMEAIAAERPASSEILQEEARQQVGANPPESQAAASSSDNVSGECHEKPQEATEWAAGAEPQYFAPLLGTALVSLMQRHKVTISELAKRTGITRTRIREARDNGLSDRNAVRDWLQAILGRDPGPIGERPANAPYTLDNWLEFRHRFSEGEIDAAGLQQEYRRMQAGKAHFIDQLVQTKTADELRLMAMQAGCFDATRNNKQRNADALYRTHLSSFALGESVRYSPMQETYDEALEKIVLGLTDAKIAAQREKDRRERAAREKALTNPETYEEYVQFAGRKGTDTLSDEQLATWDQFNAEISRGAHKQKQKETVERFEAAGIDGVDFRIIEGFHDREQVRLWIVQLASRVERAAFNELKIKASQLGGWWSSFKKEAAGFQFRSQESAEKFAGLAENDADRSDELAARKLRRMDSASERLYAVAQSLEEKASEVLAADEHKLKNTARRADMAASMRADAYRDQADAKTLRSIAAALSEGQATYLDGVWNAAQVRTLQSTLRQARRLRIERCLKEEGIERPLHRWSQRYDQLQAEPLCVADARFAVFPKPHLYKNHLRQAIAQLGSKPGVKQATANLRKLVDRCPKDQDFVEFVNDREVELLEDFLVRAKNAGCRIWWFDHCLDEYKRLRSAHLYDNHELRCALRELVPHLAAAVGDDPVAKAEDELRGKDLPGFYPTPRPLIERMLDDAEIEPTHCVLEPSCGKGDIVDAIRRRCPEADIVAIERNLTLQGVLTAKGYGDVVRYEDFLEHRGQYDRIVMNPPIENGQDADHIRHAYELLAPGGRVVAIASEGPFFRQDGKAFRDFLASVDDACDELLPDDSFKGIEAFRQTGVKTRLVVPNKP